MSGDQPRHVGALPKVAAERLAGQDEERPQPLAAQAVQPGQDRAAGQSRQGRRPVVRHFLNFFFLTYAFKRNFFSMKFFNRVMGTYFFYCYVCEV